MTHRIHINDIRLYAYHGCMDEEARVGGEYLIDVTIDTDFTAAVRSDSLSDTIDYCGVFEVCKAEMSVRSKLIEQVCARIHRRMRERFPAIERLEVKLTKLHPPVNGPVDRVSVTIAD
jgi:dihydroneopterin aldolase